MFANTPLEKFAELIQVTLGFLLLTNLLALVVTIWIVKDIAGHRRLNKFFKLLWFISLLTPIYIFYPYAASDSKALKRWTTIMFVVFGFTCAISAFLMHQAGPELAEMVQQVKTANGGLISTDLPFGLKDKLGVGRSGESGGQDEASVKQIELEPQVVTPPGAPEQPPVTSPQPSLPADFSPAMAKAAYDSCQANDVLACVTLSSAYGLGKGVEPSPAYSAFYAEKACGLGHSYSCLPAGLWVYDQGRTPQEKARGLALLQRACDGKVPNACEAIKARAAATH